VTDGRWYVAGLALLLIGWISAACTSGSGAASAKIVLSAGGAHSCLLEKDGYVYCWGSNYRGEIGNGSSQDPEGKTEVPLGESAVAVAAGVNHTCAVLRGGAVKCWGLNNRGQLGDGTTSDSRTPINVKGVSDAVAVAAGFTDSCAVLGDGSVMCWGNNEHGQIGNGQGGQPFVTTAVKVTGLPEPAVSVAVGMGHVCALVKSGSVYCWGSDMLGQLGDGTTRDSPRPIRVVGLDDAVAIDAGGNHTCVAKKDGSVACWGINDLGQLGLGVYGVDTADIHAAPASVAGIQGAVSVTLGQSLSCALERSGAAKCWGWNDSGAAGSDTGEMCAAQPCVLSPSPVQGLPKGATAISAGDQFVCALYKDSSTMCWGNNGAGQLADGATTSSTEPVKGLDIVATPGK
jgi:alpha-tubulin suppressor-like RCC1 family protein